MLDGKLQKTNSPLSPLSICITSYNKSGHLNQTLQQLEELRNLGAELVIIDDGSTDDSPKMLSDYAIDRNDVKLHLQFNHGSADARNKAIQFSTREILFFLDIDESKTIEAVTDVLNSGKMVILQFLLMTWRFKKGRQIFVLLLLEERFM